MSKGRWLGILAVAHLGVMATALFPGAVRGRWARALGGYARLTEAGSSFGFFSPNVTNQLTVSFRIRDARGRERSVSLPELLNRETSIRVKNMIRFFSMIYSRAPARRAVAASLAAYLFRKYPDAREIRLDAKMFELPGLSRMTIEGPREREVYHVTFTRS